VVIGIVAAVLGLLFGTAAIVIPRMVNRHNQPEDHSDSIAYLASTGRSAEDIARGNAGSQARPDNDGESPARGRHRTRPPNSGRIGRGQD
jgi:hypothetical protein